VHAIEERVAHREVKLPIVERLGHEAREEQPAPRRKRLGVVEKPVVVRKNRRQEAKARKIDVVCRQIV
jgi:hypothetical protein